MTWQNRPSRTARKGSHRKLRGWIYTVGAVLCLFGVVAALKVLGAAILILLR